MVTGEFIRKDGGAAALSVTVMICSSPKGGKNETAEAGVGTNVDR